MQNITQVSRALTWFEKQRYTYIAQISRHKYSDSLHKCYTSWNSRILDFFLFQILSKCYISSDYKSLINGIFFSRFISPRQIVHFYPFQIVGKCCISSYFISLINGIISSHSRCVTNGTSIPIPSP